MSVVSNDLIWQIVKKQNSFLKTDKAKTISLSSEKGNVLSLSTPKFSGLSNSKTIDVSVVKHTGKSKMTYPKVAVTIKNMQPTNVKTGTKTVVLTKGLNKNGNKAAASITAATFDKDFCPNMTKFAVKRFNLLNSALAIKQSTAKAGGDSDMPGLA